MTNYRILLQPCFPNYARVQDRLESFKETPENLRSLLPNIAEAGFFYHGHGDGVCCFHCSVLITQWEKSDEPWIEHAYYSPHCEFLLANKTKKWIRQAFNARARLMEGEVIPKKNLPIDDPPSPLKCHICLERELRIAFLPCGHLCACGMCAPGLTHCPMCREEAEDTVRIFTC